MNKANKLTVLRLILVIPFCLFLWLSYLGANDTNQVLMALKAILRVIAVVIFVVAAITDYFDGKIARETNTITDFGKLMDPIADKALTFGCLVILLHAHVVSILFFLILLFRDFIINAERSIVSAKSGKAIPASNLGKLKTICLFIALLIIMLLPNVPGYTLTISTILLLPGVILSVLSAVQYHSEAWKYLDKEM